MLTFGEKTSVSIVHVTAQEPSIAKVIIPLNELYAVTLGQTQFISASSHKIVDDQQDGAGRRICSAALS